MRTDPDALKVARKAAAPGERVLWAARAPFWRWPAHDVVHAGVMALAVWWGILWALADAPALPRPAILMVLAVPLLVFTGLFAFALVRDLRTAAQVHAVTDFRVLVIDRNGVVRQAVGVDRVAQFRLAGRTLHLGDETQAFKDGRTDLDGGLARFDALPKLKGLEDPEGVLALIRKTAGAT